jgi:hypothetical protein
MQKPTHKLKPINAVGNPNQTSKEKLVLPPLPCTDMTACVQSKDTDMITCVQNKDTDMESKTELPDNFSTHTTMPGWLLRMGQIWVEGMRVRKGCRLHGLSTCTGAAVDFVCAHQEPDTFLCMSRTARRRWL